MFKLQTQVKELKIQLEAKRKAAPNATIQNVGSQQDLKQVFEYTSLPSSDYKTQNPPTMQSIDNQSNDDNYKIEVLEKKARLLTKKHNKDEKLLAMQKKMFDKHTQKLNLKIQQLEQVIKEKDSEIRMQALKIKELIYAGGTEKTQAIVRRDFMLL